MRLIGMLDSPYVRRVAISLEFLGVPFEHEAVSVFRNFDRFQSINPVAKALDVVEVGRRQTAFSVSRSQTSNNAAVASQFTQSVLADLVPAARHPGLVRLSSRLEQTPEFRKYAPVAPGVAPAGNSREADRPDARQH